MKKYRYIWLPSALLIYGIAMAAWFGPELIRAGRSGQVWGFVIFDIILCAVLSVFIYKRSKF